MGLTNHLFAKETDMIIENYQEEWSSYFTNVDHKPASIALDLGFKNIAPLSQKSNSLWISIDMKNPTQDGFSSHEESELLWEIEDKLVDTLEEKYQSVFVGRLTSNGERALYLYINEDKQYDATIAKVMESYPSYVYRHDMKKDPKWDIYFNFLFPSPIDFQDIMNRRVLANLESHGDSLEKPRVVYHWISFHTENEKKEFLDKIKELSFKIEDEIFDEKHKDIPYILNISRIDKVDYSSVSEYTLSLWKLAQECNASYDGWETSIETENNQ
jgi:uncharacterized protein (TIGR01619 family)